MSNCLLIWIYSYFVPFEIYVYIIFWNIIYSLQEMNSATVWDSWCITLSFRCFALLLFVVISFAVSEEGVPFWEVSRALTLQGQLPMDSWNLRHHNTEPRASFCSYKMPKEARVLLYCFLPCAIVACKLGLHTILYIQLIYNNSFILFQENIFRILAFTQIERKDAEVAAPPCC